MSLVSIVTPTFPDREPLLLSRCIPSVAGLDWPEVEHVIVSDRNPGLAGRINALGPWRYGHTVRVVEINESWRNPTSERSIGAIPFALGSVMALGDYVGYVGDDDELLPHHAKLHVEKLAEADFSVSVVEFRANGALHSHVGAATFAHGQVTECGIMCRVSALQVATWTANGENAADYRVVRDWAASGLRGAFVDSVTAVHHDGWTVSRTGRPDRPGYPGWS